MDNMNDQNGNGKVKLSLRSGLSINSWDKSPPTSAKLMLNHGKPNFTIPRPSKLQNGHNTESIVSNGINSTTKSNGWTPNKPLVCNGAIKANTLERSRPMSLNASESEVENEMAKVVLRRTNILTSNGNSVENGHTTKRNEEPEVPEFIRRQRQIQERLAKENILDFEKRRSGYFTHFVITPTSPQRQSFGETMSSPAIVPALEIPPPVPEVSSVENKVSLTNGYQHSIAPLSNGDMHDIEEEEVAKAIEEVNKAVAGEDDDNKSNEDTISRVEVEEEIISLISDAMKQVSTNSEATEETCNSIPDRSSNKAAVIRELKELNNNTEKAERSEELS